MLRIFRWHGGYAGDSILHSVLSANPNLRSNIICKTIQHTGQAEVDSDKEHALYKLAHHNNDIMDPSILEEEFKNIINDKTCTHFIKTHCYHKFLDRYDDFIVDIICTNNLLSFTVAANFHKTYKATLKKVKQSNKLYKLLEERISREDADDYLIYQIAVSHYKHNLTVLQSKNKILLDKWIDLQYNNIIGYDFDINIYKSWRDRNDQYLNKNKPGWSSQMRRIEKICDLVKQEVPYREIRKQLV